MKELIKAEVFRSCFWGVIVFIDAKEFTKRAAHKSL
jgi:hypothetical protein